VDGQRILKEWMELKTEKPKFIICNEANAGGETTAQRLLTLGQRKNHVERNRET